MEHRPRALRPIRWDGILEGYQNEFVRGWDQGLAIGLALGVLMVVALVWIVGRW